MKPFLHTEGLAVGYNGHPLLEEVCLAVRRGEILTLIGPNGAGKTTFFNICSGVYGPTSGAVYLDGEDISGKYPEEVAKRGMARTFQNIRISAHGVQCSALS